MDNGGLPRGQTCTNAAGEPPARTQKDQGQRRRDTWNRVVVFGLSAVAACLLWTKLHTLPWLDPAWWLQEMARFAQGQVPYRDYYWPYPPLAVFVFGIALRVLGVKSWVVQTVIDAFSLAVMLGIHHWPNRLLPARLQALNCVLLLAACVTTETYLSLLSCI